MEKALGITVRFLLSINVVPLVKFGVKRNLLALKPLILALYPLVRTPPTSARLVSAPRQRATSED